jgi:hypothetical protein
LRPYYVNHPQFLPEPLSIPSVEKLEPGVLAFQDAVKKAKQTFAFIALGDHNFPQANSKLPLAEKPRLEVWSNGSNYWPGIYRKKLFGLSLPQQEAEVAPPAAVEAYKAGQQLAYLCESGVGATMLARSHEEGELVLDLRFLEIYETKPDYEPYGGQAFFYIDAKSERLVLRSVIAPRTRIEILANPEDATFRRAEAMVIASLYYYVVSGKHLTEIHMTYNLVEAAMYNAFDAQGQWTHPFRTALYLHTFSHELAEELTTEHLVQDGAVFTQIFATTHSALIQHLNDGYEAFEYGKDEEFETRTELFSIKTEAGERKLLPNAAITWELELVAIWTRYADALVDIIYEDDAAVLDDRYIQDFFQELSVVLSKPLPPRYAKLTTKAGVSRFMSDTIHHPSFAIRSTAPPACRASTHASRPRRCPATAARPVSTSGARWPRSRWPPHTLASCSCSATSSTCSTVSTPSTRTACATCSTSCKRICRSSTPSGPRPTRARPTTATTSAPCPRTCTPVRDTSFDGGTVAGPSPRRSKLRRGPPPPARPGQAGISRDDGSLAT